MAASSTADPLSLGVIGFGGRGESVATAAADAENVALEAICDVDPDRVEAAGAAFPVDTYREADALLDRDGLEAVAVITRVSGHAPLSVRAMEAGNHVLCTKPLAANVAEATRMVATARRTDSVGVVDFQNRFRPCYWTLNGIAADLDPLQVLITNQRSMFHERYIRPGYAYGLMDSVSHRIDLANWLVDRTPTAVSASLRYETFAPGEAIDAVDLRIEYTGGRTANLLASMGGSGLDEVCQVVGREGNAQRVDEATVEVREIAFSEEFGEGKARQRVRDPRLESASPPGDPEAPTTAMVEAFARRVRGDPDPGIATFEDGLDALLVAKAAVRSHETGDRITLGELREETVDV
jgi:predicted dehydrogenase